MVVWKFLLFYLSVILFFLLVLLASLKLKLVNGGEYQEKEQVEIVVEATRGDILSVDGRKIACSVPSYKLYMDTRAVKSEIFHAQVDELAIALSKFFRDQPASVYAARLRRARKENKQYYAVNPRKVSYKELQQIKQFPIFKLGRNKGGFMPEQSDHRKLPFGSLASRTVGKLFNEKSKGGIVGIEQSYDDVLRGESGISTLMKTSHIWIKHELVPPVDGKSIVSTIDIDIQDVAEHSLEKQLRRHNARHGVAILMEVKTGAVRAIVNLHRTPDGSYTEDYFNYAIGESSEPGSTFKLASIIAALEDGYIELDDTIHTYKGAFRFYDRVMRDSKEGGHGVMTVQDAFEKSSNIAISRLIDRYYRKNPRKFIDRLEDLGLRDSLGLEIRGEGTPLVKDPSDPSWSGITLPWMSIGYEVMMTPLQTLALYNAIANDGKMMKPRFVEGIMERGEMVERMRPEVIRSSICSYGTVQKVKKLLKGVVENGTAQNMRGTPYGIAGKTGTAQIARGAGGYKHEGTVNYLASFAGYFPADDPVYSCIVVVNGPSNNVYYGNVVSGSVFKEIADRVYAAGYKNPDMWKEPKPVLGERYPQSKGGKKKDLETVLKGLDLSYKRVKTDGEWVSSQAEKGQILLKKKKITDGLVPDVRGMGAKDAVNILESAGLYVNLSGVGKVVSQSLSAGQTYRKGSTIFIKLG